MKKRVVKGKFLVISSAILVVSAAVAVPIGIIYGNKNSSFETIIKNVDLEYGSEPIVESVDGYAKPKLEKSNFSSAVNVGEKNIYMIYFYDVNNSNTNLKPYYLKLNINVIKVATKTLESKDLMSEQFGYYNNEPNKYLTVPALIDGYIAWTEPLYTRLDNQPIGSSNDVKMLAPGSKYVAIYSTEVDKNHTGPRLEHKVVVTIKNEKFASVSNTIINKDLHFGEAIPLDFTPPQVTGYKKWVNPLFYDAFGNLMSEKPNNLKLNDKFLMKFKADLLDFNVSDIKTIEYIVSYTVVKGIADKDPSGSFKTFYSKVTDGSEKFPTTLEKKLAVKGYLPWECKYTSINGETVYETAQAINQLELGKEFVAVYSAKKDPNFNAVTDATFSVTYKVKDIADPSEYLYKNFSKDEAKLPEILLDKPHPGWLLGKIKYFSKTDVSQVYTSIEQIKSLPLNSVFLATYTAEPDPAQTNIKNAAVYTVEYTIKNSPTTDPSVDNLSANFEYGMHVFPVTLKPTKAVGYKDWKTAIFTSVNEETVYDDPLKLSTLSVGTKFKATYIAEPDENYNILNNAKVVVTYEVIKAKYAELVNKIFDEEFIYNTNLLPTKNEPTAPAIGYGNWIFEGYKSVNNPEVVYSTAKQLSALPIKERFIAKYVAKPNSNYELKDDASISVIYTVVQVLKEKFITKSISAEYEFAKLVLPSVGAPSITEIGYQAWSPKPIYSTLDYKKEYKTVQELAALNIGSKFLATYTAQPDPNYDLKESAMFIVTYEVVKNVSIIDPSKTYSSTIVYGTEVLPNDFAPSGITPGYKEWSKTATYLTNENEEIASVEELSKLPAGSTFKATYIADIDPNYTALKPAKVVVNYNINKASKSEVLLKNYDANYSLSSTKMPSINAPVGNELGYLTWDEVKYTNEKGDKVYTTVVELNQLALNDTFLAIYTAKPDLNYKIANDAKITVKYTVTKD